MTTVEQSTEQSTHEFDVSDLEKFFSLNEDDKFNSGGEFDVFDIGNGYVLKKPRHERLLDIISGGTGKFHEKTKASLEFLQENFSKYTPETEIVERDGNWAILQKKIQGKPFLADREMTDNARNFFEHASYIRETMKMSIDLIGGLEIITLCKKSGNILVEEKTGRLYYIDVSAGPTDKLWPIGNLISKMASSVQWKIINAIILANKKDGIK